MKNFTIWKRRKRNTSSWSVQAMAWKSMWIRMVVKKVIKNCQLLDTSRILTFWSTESLHSRPLKNWIFLNFQECLHCGPFQNYYVLDYSWISTFWTIPEILYFGPSQNFYILDRSRIFMLSTIRIFFYILDCSRNIIL